MAENVTSTLSYSKMIRVNTDWNREVKKNYEKGSQVFVKRTKDINIFIRPVM